MKQYDVFGVGSAIVDMEFEIKPDELQRMGIDKGVMTLVDEARHTELINHIDGVHHTRACGGSAANTIVALAQFGAKSYYCCRMAKDESGSFFFEGLKQAGVKSPVAQDGEGKTGKCMIFVTPDADRTMNTYLGISAELSPEDLDETALAASNYVYIEGYLVSFESGKATAMRARELADQNGVKTALTFSDPNMVKFFRDGFEQIVGNGVDMVFCNESEALMYTETPSAEQAAEKLKTIARTFVITLGSQGALVYDGESILKVGATSVKAVDTTGAGDMFAGAFLYAITHGYNHAAAARLACRAGSQVVSRFGPRLTTDETSELLHQPDWK